MSAPEDEGGGSVRRGVGGADSHDQGDVPMRARAAEEDDETMTACVANIGPRGRRRRLLSGIVLFGIGVGLSAFLVWSGQPRAWRLLAFAPFWIGAFGIFQARARTCAVLAARGQRDLDRGAESIADPAELLTVRRQGRQVQFRTLLAAVVLTGGVLLLPG